MKDRVPEKPTRSRLTQEERRVQTRQHFLDSAQTLFARQGFAGTTLDQISEQAGYSRGAFHHHFSSKEDLLVTLISACFKADIQTLHGLHDAGQARQIEEFRGHSDNTPLSHEYHLLKLEFWICALRYPRVGQVYAQEFATYRQALAQLIHVTALSDSLDSEHLAAILIALGNGLDTQRLIDPEAIPANLYDDALRRFSILKPDGR